jgi:hypothetical protein
MSIIAVAPSWDAWQLRPMRTDVPFALCGFGQAALIFAADKIP